MNISHEEIINNYIKKEIISPLNMNIIMDMFAKDVVILFVNIVNQMVLKKLKSYLVQLNIMNVLLARKKFIIIKISFIVDIVDKKQTVIILKKIW